jgi:hypothetical protein
MARRTFQSVVEAILREYSYNAGQNLADLQVSNTKRINLLGRVEYPWKQMFS